MSASRQHAQDLRKGASVLPEWVKDAARATLAPVVRLAIALRLTPNTITVIGLVITIVAALLVANGQLLVGAAILTAGSLLDAVDGALARATDGGTPFGGFLDSTLDRVGDAAIFGGLVLYFAGIHKNLLAAGLALACLILGFVVSYSKARAEGLGMTAAVGIAERADRLLVSIRSSRPVFKVEEWKLSAALDKVTSIAGLKVAFIADTREVQMSQEYIALLGRQRGLQFESFESEAAALAWLTSSSA
jgi:CDP-diacylglycerol--glycerol-3-phosphate 3-phosphatidyltransferase